MLIAAPSRRLRAMLMSGAILVGACATESIHIAQLNTGMTRTQVEDVQGKPDEVKKSGDYAALRYGKNFWVVLEHDRVVAFGSGTVTRYPGSDRYFIDESYP